MPGEISIRFLGDLGKAARHAHRGTVVHERVTEHEAYSYFLSFSVLLAWRRKLVQTTGNIHFSQESHSPFCLTQRRETYG